MAIKYGTHYVDERYSSLFEPNLFTGAWLIPNVTCSDRYAEKAGGIYVHKIKDVSAVKPKLPTGKKNDHKDATDELIQIALNNEFFASHMIPDVVAAACAAPVANEYLSAATQEVREGREFAALACLATEGASLTGAELTPENVKAEIINARTKISEHKGNANVILCSPAVYGMILNAFGKEFLPVTNEKVQLEGRVAKWLGFLIVECQALASADGVEYIDYTGATKTITSDSLDGIDFVMYNNLALSVIDNLSRLRLIDTDPDFAGTYAQVVTNTGFRVTNSNLVCVRKHA
jgi:hypothetical protein